MKPSLTRAARQFGAVAAIGAAVTCGCIRTSEVRPTELASLDGYDIGRPGQAARPLQTLDAGKITFDSGSRLALMLPGERIGSTFASISVHDGAFEGTTTDGRTVEVPVSEIRSADVKRHDLAGTIFIVLAVVAAAGAAGGVYWSTTQSHLQPPVSGRALRVGGRAIVAPPSTADGWRGDAPGPELAGLSPGEREILAAFWTDTARAEHASVPAFSRLSLTLLALGAPARLVEAAHRAALDEIEHARLAFALASAYAGRMIAPGPLVALQDARAATATTLVALAEESFVDGCYLEGLAASAAAATRVRSRDASVRAALTVITRDERTHAELAWQIVIWCRDAGGPTVAERLLALAARLPSPPVPRDAPADHHDALAAHGWLPPELWIELARRARVDVSVRAARALAAPVQAAPLRLA